MSVDLGEVVPLGIIVRETAAPHDPIDAENVALTINAPDGTAILPPISNPPAITGHYPCDYLPTMPGHYTYRWQTTRPTLVMPGSFDVLDPAVSGLVSLRAAKDILRIEQDDYEHDDDIRDVIVSATTAAENVGQRILGRQQFEQTFNLRHPKRSLIVAQRPVIDVLSVMHIDSGSLLVPPFVRMEKPGIVRPASLGFGRGTHVVTYTAGHVIIPSAVREALLHIIGHLWSLRQGNANRPQPGGRTGDAPDSMGYAIPNRARDLLSRPWPKVG